MAIALPLVIYLFVELQETLKGFILRFEVLHLVSNKMWGFEGIERTGGFSWSMIGSCMACSPKFSLFTLSNFCPFLLLRWRSIYLFAHVSNRVEYYYIIFCQTWVIWWIPVAFTQRCIPSILSPPWTLFYPFVIPPDIPPRKVWFIPPHVYIVLKSLLIKLQIFFISVES